MFCVRVFRCDFWHYLIRFILAELQRRFMKQCLLAGSIPSLSELTPIRIIRVWSTISQRIANICKHQHQTMSYLRISAFFWFTGRVQRSMCIRMITSLVSASFAEATPVKCCYSDFCRYTGQPQKGMAINCSTWNIRAIEGNSGKEPVLASSLKCVWGHSWNATWRAL